MQTVSFCWPYSTTVGSDTVVSLAGSFNSWKAVPMHRSPVDGWYRLDVPLASGGTYEYKFVLNDNDWRVDPMKPQNVDPQSGVVNNVIVLEEVLDGHSSTVLDAPPPTSLPPDSQVKGQTAKGKRGRKEKRGLIETEPTIGTRDFYPADMRKRNWLFNHFKEVARQYAFQEYDSPILELEDLYKRKAGEEITSQMYNFHSKDGNWVALRPEMTPSLARLILKAGMKMVLPIKWYSIPQCWRFETTTRGRKREHYQWNMDIIGVTSVNAEIELLSAIVAFFKRVGLTSSDVGIKINSRQVLQEVLTPLGVNNEIFAPVCVIVDKLDKLPPEEVVRQLTELGLDESVIAVIQNTLSIKRLEDLKDVLSPNSNIISELNLIWTVAKDYGFDDWLVFDASVVRGLAYYTGIVFECFDRGGSLRAIAGGGRYNRLLSTYGSSKEIAACGFGFGDCVIMELLEDKKLLPVLEPEVDDVVIVYDETLRGVACKVANKLRSYNRRVDLQLVPKKPISWCFNYADRIGAKRAVLVAPDEWLRGEVRVKDLTMGGMEIPDELKQKFVKFDDL